MQPIFIKQGPERADLKGIKKIYKFRETILLIHHQTPPPPPTKNIHKVNVHNGLKGPVGKALNGI